MSTVSVTVEFPESLYDALLRIVESSAMSQDQAIAMGVASFLMANGDEKMVAIAAQSYEIGITNCVNS